MTRLILIFAALLCLAPAAQATTYYVNETTGNDSNNGTAQGTPFKRIQKCESVAVADDFCMLEGTFTLPTNDNFCNSTTDYMVCLYHHSGTSGHPITYKSLTPGSAVLDGQNVTIRVGFTNIGADYLKFEGLRFTRFTDFEATQGLGGGAAGIELFAGGLGSIIYNCEFDHIGNITTATCNGQVGVYIHQDSITVDSNKFHDIGRTGGSGQECNAGVDAGHDHGIYHSQGNNDLIKNNLFYNIARGWAIQNYPSANSGTKIVNNTFGGTGNVDSGNGGFMTVYQTNITSCEISNNIYAPSSVAGTYFIHKAGTESFSGCSIRNNLTTVANMTTAGGFSGSPTVSGNLTSTAAGFNNAGSNDYSITSGSAAKDAGVTLTSDVPVDILAVSRPQGSAYDIGAYELVQTAARTPMTGNAKISGGVTIQ